MTPGARHAAAMSVCDKWIDGAPLEKALLAWARGARYAGSKDRAVVRDICFQIARCRNTYAFFGGGHSGRGLIKGYIVCDGRLAPVSGFEERLKDLLAGGTYDAAPLDDQEYQELVELSSCNDFTPDIPDWLIEQAKESLGEEFAPTMQHLRKRANVFLRVNLSRTTVADAQRSLQADGIETEAFPTVQTALRVLTNPRRVAQSDAYMNGLLDIQDLSAQSICLRVPVTADMRVLDYCAGGGGKALALADRGARQIFAYDSSAKRMEDLATRASRAGVEIGRLDLEAVKANAPYDLIVCDVPCSGSGSWRRAPDGKWSLTPDRLEQLLVTQASILDQASELLRPGGTLAYITCSFLKLENSDQVQKFMSRNSSFDLREEISCNVSPDGDGFYYAELVQ